MKAVDTIIIDSKDKESYSASTTSFTVKVPDAHRNIKEYRIRKVGIPLAMDNIVAANNGYEIDDVAGSIDVGQYSVSDLVAWMTANIAGYTVTFDLEGRITISQDALGNFKWEPLQCFTLLGFSSILYNGSASYTAERLPYLLPTKYITMHSDFLYKRRRHHTIHTDRRSNLIAFIPLISSLGDLQVFIPDEPLIIFVDHTNNSILDFEFRDDSNTVIDIQSKDVFILLERWA